MKKIIPIIAIALLAVGCGKKNYTVEGTIEGLTGKVMIKHGNDIIAETDATDGNFEFKGTVEKPDIYMLAAGNGNLGMLFLENGARIKVLGHMDGNNADVEITGTAAHENYSKYLVEEEALYERMTAFPNDSENIRKDREAHIEKSIDDNLDNMFGILVLRNNYYAMEPVELLEKLDRIPARYQDMKIVAQDMRPIAEARIRTGVGNKYVDFTLEDMEGNDVALSSAIAPGKYVLLDFWASWCGPCIRELPYLKAAYGKYRDRGFDIFGVSLDSARENWIACVENNQMDWIHVSALQGWSCPAAKLYGVSSIPASYLIGPDGTILAKNLRGEELEEKLAELIPAGE